MMVMDDPAENWGQSGDIGVVGELHTTKFTVGACWMRLLPVGIGAAFVDELTPQLGLAVTPEYQRKGFGRALMMSALELARTSGVKQLSLTVHPENPAIRLYDDCGFRNIGESSTYDLMVVTL